MPEQFDTLNTLKTRGHKSVTVQAPATSANLGPGFDTLGLALQVYNRFKFSWAQHDALIAPPTHPELQTDAPAQLDLYRAMDLLWHHAHPNQPRPRVCVELLQADIPLARGMGSSASAVVAGLVGLNALAQLDAALPTLGQLATQIEGHPDNVLPALYGGLQFCASGVSQAFQAIKLDWPSHWQPVLVIPASKTATKEARSALPKTIPIEDAVFNLQRTGLWVLAIQQQNGDLLRWALHDKLHEPTRSQWITGFTDYQQAALSAGAYGLVISGSGPTLLVITPAAQSASVQAQLSQCAQGLGQHTTQIIAPAVDTTGAQVL
ncbi:MAG: homoserine kinase [Vampirovibrionales bacterium]|nr:homoserine kinase [Vampirovibrionales bacterium]